MKANIFLLWLYEKNIYNFINKKWNKYKCYFSCIKKLSSVFHRLIVTYNHFEKFSSSHLFKQRKVYVLFLILPILIMLSLEIC